MAQMGRPGLSPEGKSEVWRRWRAGESFLGIGKALGKPAGSIYGVIRLCGGYTPAARKRSLRALTLSEREEISRGVSAGLSIRAIARQLNRAPSTISREIARNGGTDHYRALEADERALQAALRPKRCLLEQNRRLRYAVERKLCREWSPEQVSGWLKNRYADDEALRELGVAPEKIGDVVLTHLHYDHAGNVHKLPAATFHLQDAEMEFATGRCMCHRRLRHAYSPDDVEQLIRRVYDARVTFHRGRESIRPGVELIHVGGHTRGLQIVRVRTRRGWIVLASDASHYYENMSEANPYPLQYSMAETLSGYMTCMHYADSADHVVPGHDPLVLSLYPRVAGLSVDVCMLHEAPCEPALGLQR